MMALNVLAGANVDFAAVPKTDERVKWIDVAKGLAIVLVVLGHALGGMIDVGNAMAPAWARYLFAGIYIFHMPLFFLLAGLFVAKRIEKSRSGFAKSALVRIVWPYFLWSIIQVSVIAIASAYVTHPVESLSDEIVKTVYSPPSQFWFLYALLLLHRAALTLLPRCTPTVILVLSFAAASLAEAGLLPGILAMAAKMAPFYAMGVILGPRVQRAGPRSIHPLALGFVPLALAVIWGYVALLADQSGNVILSASSSELAEAASGFRMLAGAIIGAIAVCTVAATLSGQSALVLRYLGAHSMSIFVLHVMAVAGTRIVLINLLHVESFGVILPLIVGAGVAFPLMAFEVLKRARLLSATGLS